MESNRGNMNPYAAGILLGVLAAAVYAILGTGFCESSAAVEIVRKTYGEADSIKSEASSFFKTFCNNSTGYSMLFMAFGMAIGSFFSALSNKRAFIQVERGKSCSKFFRLFLSIIGGFIAAFGISYSRGGILDNLLGGFSVLSTGSFVFIVAAIFSGYIVSVLFWRQWND